MFIETVKLLLIVITIIAFSIVIQSCHKPSASAPERNLKIPSTAVWAGGIDGGYWFVVTPARLKNTFYVRIYNEYSGDIDTEGLFTLHDNCSVIQLDSTKLLENIRWYNGEAIFLKLDSTDSNCSLISVKALESIH